MRRRRVGTLEIQECLALVDAGVSHGFGGSDFDARNERLESAWAVFGQSFSVDKLHLLDQVHGTEIVHVASLFDVPAFPQADGWFLRRGQSGAEGRQAFGVRTADCLPIIMASSQHVAILHAGWRGVCSGIQGKAADLFRSQGPLEEVIVVLGPCAGKDSYEAGGEVIEKFGERGVFHVEAGRTFLDIRATVWKSLEASGIKARMIHSSAECTMLSHQYHSYRRDGHASGRNLSFVIL